jgi:Neuraminidase (sialidase)
MLAGPWVPANPHQLDFAALPKVPSEHAVVSDVRAPETLRGKLNLKTGGVKAIDDWQSFPVLGSASEPKAEEPEWWILLDHRLAAVFRDNRRSGFLYRAVSTDAGRTWSKPVKTNFPDATP